MNIDHKCTNCGSNNLRVRTSERIGLLTIRSVAYCNNCGTELITNSQITRVRTPIYKERPEAMRITKCLLRTDFNTPDLFDGVVGEQPNDTE